MTEDAAHQVSVTWKHHRLRSEAQIAKGRNAALQVLASGGTPRKAAAACVKEMYGGVPPLFGGFIITINGQPID